MLNLTRRLLALRKTRPELAGGAIHWLDDIPTDVLAYRRRRGQQVSYCLINFAARPATVRVPEPLTILTSTSTDQGRAAESDIQLRPHEAVIAVPSRQAIPVQSPGSTT